MTSMWLRSWRLGCVFLGRDWRSGELRLLTLSLVIAVAAMTSVGFFVDRLRSGLERNAAQLMGADLVVSADLPIDDGLRRRAQHDGLTIAQTVTFQSMAVAGDLTHLTAVKAVSPGYPLRGTLRIATGPGVADAPTQTLPQLGSVWVDAALLDALKLHIGDALQLGERSFTITHIITVEPDRGLSFANIAPRVMMRLEDLPATALLQAGSRETNHLLLAGTAPAITEFQTWLTPQLARGQHLESLSGGRPEVRAALDRAERFLSLVALLTAMLAAVAVALAARRFTQRHLDSCAIMRCLGSSQNELLHVFLAEFSVLGAVGAGLGVILGFAAHFIFILILGGLIQTGLPAPSALPALQGFVLGFVLLIGFALPPVIQLRQVTPLRVLRRDLGLPRASAAAGYLIGVGLFIALLLWAARDLKVGFWTAGGFLGAFIIFSLASWIALKLSVAVRHGARLSPALRFALASMQRRPVAMIVQTVALAIGLMALLLLSVTRNDLVADWRKATPVDAPNRFIINILPEQQQAFAASLRASGISAFDMAPMVRGRLVRINDRVVGAHDYPDENAQRLVDREFNLSYTTTTPAHNLVTSGQWFAPDAREFSVEEGIAKTLHLKLGDTLVFDVAGQQSSARVTSLRKLEWDSMHVNFFVIGAPSTLAGLPQTWISAFHVSDADAAKVNSLVLAYPNITVIDTGAILKQIQDILDQVVTAVEFLFGFTLLTGVLVLYAALLSSRDERTREAALLRALGASRRQLLSAQFAEFIGVGVLAGVLASAGAVAIGWVLATQAFDFPYAFGPLPWVLGTVAGAAIAWLGGWLGLRPVLNQPPLASLRDL